MDFSSLHSRNQLQPVKFVARETHRNLLEFSIQSRNLYCGGGKGGRVSFNQALAYCKTGNSNKISNKILDCPVVGTDNTTWNTVAH